MDGKINRIKVMQIAKLLNVELNNLVRFEALPEIPSPIENVTQEATPTTI